MFDRLVWVKGEFKEGAFKNFNQIKEIKLTNKIPPLNLKDIELKNNIIDNASPNISWIINLKLDNKDQSYFQHILIKNEKLGSLGDLELNNVNVNYSNKSVIAASMSSSLREMNNENLEKENKQIDFLNNIEVKKKIIQIPLICVINKIILKN